MVAFTDGRITESSGAAMSLAHENAFWTINDENTKPHCFLVDAATGNTIGTFSFKNADIVDPEAISVDKQGRLWYADIGDGGGGGPRNKVALYMVAEPEAKNNGELKRSKYILKYPGSTAVNAETLLTRRSTGEMFIITKETNSRMYGIPTTLTSAAQGGVNKLFDVGLTFGANVTDADYTPDGRWVLLRRKDENTTVFVYDATTWTEIDTITVSSQTQPEGITVAQDGLTFIITTEGQYSTFYQVAMPAPYQPVTADTEANVDLPVGYQIDGPTPSNPCG